jgi:hypothetical protein
MAHETTQLSEFISRGLKLIPNSTDPLCVLEVGTADGRGTTVSLFNAMQKKCKQENGREFQLFTYEGLPSLAREAKGFWLNNTNVVVLNELVLDENTINEYIIQRIEGPEGSTFPGKGFYQRLYSELRENVKSGVFGGFFHTRPECKLDFVLIDSTRFAHAGIIQTILQAADLKPTTIFLIENDFWPPADRNEQSILERFWELTDIVSDHPEGEQWPWLLFRIKGSVKS